MPDEGGQEITDREGETVMADLKAPQCSLSVQKSSEIGRTVPYADENSIAAKANFVSNQLFEIALQLRCETRETE